MFAISAVRLTMLRMRFAGPHPLPHSSPNEWQWYVGSYVSDLIISDEAITNFSIIVKWYHYKRHLQYAGRYSDLDKLKVKNNVNFYGKFLHCSSWCRFLDMVLSILIISQYQNDVTVKIQWVLLVNELKCRPESWVCPENWLFCNSPSTSSLLSVCSSLLDFQYFEGKFGDYKKSIRCYDYHHVVMEEIACRRRCAFNLVASLQNAHYQG